MKVLEGTPEELLAYQKLNTTELVAQPPGEQEENPAEETEEESVNPNSRKTLLRWRTSRYVLFSRAQFGSTTTMFETERMETFLRRAETELGLVPVVGKSTATTWGDGYTDYIRLYPSGKRRFGAVVYLVPGAGSMNLRLQRDDVTDLLGVDPKVVARDIHPDNVHGVRFNFSDDDAVQVALELTKRAMAKVGA